MIVEDNPALNRSLQRLLRKEGFSVSAAADTEEARSLYDREHPQIVILDVMLPDKQGYTIIPHLREHQQCYVLMLTALDDSYSKQLCYTLGADDYMTKPFDMHELVYKLRAINRRMVAHRTTYTIGDLVLDMESNEISCNGRTCVLQPSQARFLKTLYCSYIEQRYLTQADAALCQHTEFEAEDSARIHTLAARLRKNLSDLRSTSVMIESVYGKGYRLILFPEESAT